VRRTMLFTPVLSTVLSMILSTFLASGLKASPFETPPDLTPPLEGIPPRPDVPPEGDPPFDLGFEIPVGPPPGVVTGPDFEVPPPQPVGVWMMTLPVTVDGLDLDVPNGPPENLPPVFSPPSELDHPPFSEFPPDFEPPPFFDFLPPGVEVRPVFAAMDALTSPVASGTVPEPTTGLLLGMGLVGLACGRSKRR